MKKIRHLALGLLLLSPFVYAAPVVMTFEGVVGDTEVLIPVTPYAEDGFLLTSSRSADAEIEGIFGKDADEANTNGTAVFGWCSICEAEPQVISLTRDGGGAFDFLSFDAATLFVGAISSGAVEIVGYLDGGGTVETMIETTADWMTFELGWSGLVQVDFTSLFDIETEEGEDPGIDNLVMYVSVPEPGTLALLGLGLLGMAARRQLKA